MQMMMCIAAGKVERDSCLVRIDEADIIESELFE